MGFAWNRAIERCYDTLIRLVSGEYRKIKMTDGRSAGGQRIRSLTTRGIMVPLKFTLGTSAAIIKAVPLLLVDLLNEDGVTGRAYAFCYRPSGAVAISSHLFEAVDILKGKDITPFDAAQILSRQFALLGVTGTVRMALSLLDMAMWDAIAQMQRVPLCSLLGSGPKPLRAYDSRGLGLMEPHRLAAETKTLLESGLGAVKLRLGYPSLSEDMAALNAVRRSISRGDIEIMVDYNQALTSAEAILRGRMLEKEGIYWLEEPIGHEDYEASAAIARPTERSAADRRELQRSGRFAPRYWCAGERLRDGRCSQDRWRNWLAASSRRSRGPRHRNVLAPNARNQCPSPLRNANLPLA